MSKRFLLSHIFTEEQMYDDQAIINTVYNTWALFNFLKF